MFWIQITMNIIFIEFVLQLNLNLIKFKHFYEIYFINFILNIIEHIKVNDCSCWFYSYFYFAYPSHYKYIQCMNNVNISCHSCAYLEIKNIWCKKIFAWLNWIQRKRLLNFSFFAFISISNNKTTIASFVVSSFQFNVCTNTFNLLLRHPLLFSNHVIRSCS